MRRTCATCGRTFDAKTARATYCSSNCRLKAHRARQGGDVVPLGVVTPPRTPVAATTLTEATTAALEELGAVGSPEGVALLEAARRVDARDDSASGLAALLRQHAALMGQVRAMYARPERDVLDELGERRAGRGA